MVSKIIKRFRWRMFCFKSKRNANIIEKMLATHPVRSVHSFVLPDEFATNSIPTNLTMTHEFIAGFNISSCHIKLLDLPISMKGADYNITEYDKQIHIDAPDGDEMFHDVINMML